MRCAASVRTPRQIDSFLPSQLPTSVACIFPPEHGSVEGTCTAARLDRKIRIEDNAGYIWWAPERQLRTVPEVAMSEKPRARARASPTFELIRSVRERTGKRVHRLIPAE
ncbi:hypothetical protein EXIGLDRAFT_494274 [Exidia glandulosa HHB12029]|uniref:Uncharacterized protein n=1 Tax=Exidia glandulosa HHB12029 TaxID=1314781 RepID=A0A165JJA9_EXIGL|nr:hypothetical protein EXIGLDRAFT_494274 [Exidia glandulosa HHB12029]